MADTAPTTPPTIQVVDEKAPQLPPRRFRTPWQRVKEVDWRYPFARAVVSTPFAHNETRGHVLL